MSRIGTRLQRIEERLGLKTGGLVVVQAQADDPQSEEAAITEAKASGLAFEGDSFIVIRRFTNTWQEGFTPYRIGGGWGEVLRQTAENGRKIYPGPNCHAG